MSHQLLKLYFFVGVGGMIGAMSRYGISLLFHANTFFPWPTLLVNIVGSFLLTFSLFNRTIQYKLPPHLFTALTVGVIGSFTTFSAVTYETLQLWQNNVFIALGYILVSVFSSLISCYGAFLLTERWRVKK